MDDLKRLDRKVDKRDGGGTGIPPSHLKAGEKMGTKKINELCKRRYNLKQRVKSNKRRYLESKHRLEKLDKRIKALKRETYLKP